MIIVMKKSATPKDIKQVIESIKKDGFKPHVSKGVEITIIGVIGDENAMNKTKFMFLEGVDKVLTVTKPYKLVSREFKRENTIIKVNDVKIGTDEIIVMAGPCAVENKTQILKTAELVKNAGAKILRGGAFKPRTSPYSFQGLKEEGLKLLAKARNETGISTISEVMEPNDVPLVENYVDILQVGARNMQNYNLLKAVGRAKKPVFLKRGMSATFMEFLMSAEYIMSEGNHKVILCERGIRTFCEFTRNTLDLNIVPALKKSTHLPVFADPSHGTGRYDLVEPMARASIAAGADGLMIEVHPNPGEAFSDGDQSITPERFEKLMQNLKPLAKAIGRDL